MNLVPEFSFSSLKALVRLLALCVMAPSIAMADNWQAPIHENGAPAALVGVDKKKRIFNFYEKRSPLGVRYQYPCVTGQLFGDKQQINDRKTPEGIYFVGYKIANGLDFKEYGGIAYTLNYPNPVDKLRGKTGHGIWIHSKGFELAPTRGCVAIDLPSIAEIGPRLTPGLPVVLAEELKDVSNFDNGTPAQMISLMESWTKAWASKSPQMFSYYDPEAYSRATEDFSKFRQNKERLFKALDYIKIFNREIHAMEGPGYWVTWAEQLYTASNLSTEGVRRLYWQKDKDGMFRIVGMEWIPANLGMAAEYHKGKLVANVEAPVATDASSEAPIAPRLDMPEQPDEPQEAPKAAPQPALAPETREEGGSLLGKTIRELAGKFLAASEPLLPGKLPPVPTPAEIEWGTGRKIAEEPGEAPKQPAQAESASETAIPARQPEASAAMPEETPRQKESAREPAKPAFTAADKASLEKTLATWLEKLENRDKEIFTLYDARRFNKLPVAVAPRGNSLASVRQTLDRELGAQNLHVFSRPPVLTPAADVAQSSQDMLLVTPREQRQGVQHLWWAKDDNGAYKIVASRFEQRPLGLEANYLEKVSGDISEMLENWRKAWETANLDDYMSHYLPSASQPGRTGANVIRLQKGGLWTRIKPETVQLSGLRLTVEPGGIRADMTQSYKDSAGRADKGVKTLHLREDKGAWRIQREDWTALPARQE